MFCRILDKLTLGMDSKSGISIADMSVNSQRGEPEAIANFLLREAFIYQCHDPFLSRTKLMVKFRSANNPIEFAFTAQRAIDVLECKLMIRTDIRD